MQGSPNEEVPAVRHSEHRITVAAGPDEVYAVIADVTCWPRVFGPTIHAERVEFDGRVETIRLWATANGEPKTWVSRRELDAVARRVVFGQIKSQSPVRSMRGEWIVEALPGGGTSVLLTHDWLPVEDVPDADEWIAAAVERNSRAELASLKRGVEGGSTGLEATFEDTVLIDGALPAVYSFLYEAGKWPVSLPHVSRVELREDSPGLQYLEMDTTAKDGSTHTTASIRVCFTDERIVYKQLVLPKLLTLHTGCWTLTRTPEGPVRVTSRHTIRIDADMVAAVLGEGRSVADAKAFVRGALGANSLATLNRAKAAAEAGLHG
ncbi:aromatase/cyclase [Streptantibioticus silvisoli]|uniref:Aromatase/cyclase n=1 Tax=Streptantibioticus silvisoli TaxID=2705255 RepID=A0ABT6W9K3_9ACTN|nr:aromatase/cyclase [Streptantibioticus silvisoli]MDI5967329.1 aromatase/cyclase [Streptantibioticus silvisoli]